MNNQQPIKIEVVVSVCTCQLARPLRRTLNGLRFSVMPDRFVIVEREMAARDHTTSLRKFGAWFSIDVHQDLRRSKPGKLYVSLVMINPFGYRSNFETINQTRIESAGYYWHKYPSPGQVCWAIAHFIRLLNYKERQSWLGSKTPKHWRKFAKQPR